MLHHAAKISYSQCGEDLLISYVFALRGISKPTYIDIGANDPYVLSNTAIFYERGSRGINVEANPLLVSTFNICRPDDKNIHAGVADQSGEALFFILSDASLSTFSEKAVREQVEEHGRKITSSITVPLLTLNEIVDQYCAGVFPDLLNIDTEGLDLEILNSADFSNSKPKVICAETAEYSPTGSGRKRGDFISLVESKGYYAYADTNLNTIFVERNFWFLVK